MFTSVWFFIFSILGGGEKQKWKQNPNKQQTKKTLARLRERKEREELQGHKFRKYEASLKEPQNGNLKFFYFVLKFNPRVRWINYSPAFNSAAFIFFLSRECHSNIAAIKSQVCLLHANTVLKNM